MNKTIKKSLLATVFSVSLLAQPVLASESVWNVVKENSAATISNLWAAAGNACSFIPYVLKEVSSETKIVSNSLKECPILTTALVTSAAYGMYKAYKWYHAKGVDTKARLRTLLNEAKALVA